MKKRIRLTEQDINTMVEKTVRRLMGEGDNNDFMEKHSPLTRFKHDNQGADAMKTLGAIEKGGYLPHDRTPAEDADMQRDYLKRQGEKKKEAKDRQSANRSDKAWQKAADSRPLHRKGSLNRKDERIDRAIRMAINEIFDSREGQEVAGRLAAKRYNQYRDLQQQYIDSGDSPETRDPELFRKSEDFGKRCDRITRHANRSHEYPKTLGDNPGGPETKEFERGWNGFMAGLADESVDRAVREAVRKVVRETYNPFDDNDFDEWDAENVEDVTDEEYNQIMAMNPMENSDRIFKQLGFKKWNGFLKRWQTESPDEYEEFTNSQMAF